MNNIPLGISNHHIHVTREVLDILFGKDYQLTFKRGLRQLHQFASEETVTLKRGNKVLEHIRIIGPCRKYTQVELLESDNEFFNFKAPVRSSGDLENSETLTIVGPNGEYEAVSNVIVANRHIHFSKEDLVKSGLNMNSVFSVNINGKILDNVHVRCDETCVLEMHMNKDEATALELENNMDVKIC